MCWKIGKSCMKNDPQLNLFYLIPVLHPMWQLNAIWTNENERLSILVD